MTPLLAPDGFEERLGAWTVVFPDGGFPNVAGRWDGSWSRPNRLR
jgi:hypothetical protein